MLLLPILEISTSPISEVNKLTLGSSHWSIDSLSSRDSCTEIELFTFDESCENRRAIRFLTSIVPFTSTFSRVTVSLNVSS